MRKFCVTKNSSIVHDVYINYCLEACLQYTKFRSVMVEAVDIKAFLTSLEGNDLKVVRNSLKLSHLWFYQTPGFDAEPLSKHKQPCQTFKIWERRKQDNAFVVKFSRKNTKPWNNVIKREYEIILRLDSSVPVPQAVYMSSEADEAVVGRAFMIMKFVPGISFASASEVPPSKRIKVCTSALQVMAKVHRMSWMKLATSLCLVLWRGPHVKEDFDDCREFWWQQVSALEKNHSSEDEATTALFATLAKEILPRTGDTGIIHGDLSLSSFIFDPEYNVKAIIGWKCTKNGDPLADVAYFLAMFLQPANFGFGSLQDLDLLMGYPNNNTPSEDQMLSVYSTVAKRYGITFSMKDYNYAKAVICLRMITTVMTAWRDRWTGHDIGKYKGVRDRPKEVIAMLTKAGHSFCKLV